MYNFFLVLLIIPIIIVPLFAAGLTRDCARMRTTIPLIAARTTFLLQMIAITIDKIIMRRTYAVPENEPNARTVAIKNLAMAVRAHKNDSGHLRSEY